MKGSAVFSLPKRKLLLFPISILVAALLGWATSTLGIVLPIVLIGTAIFIPFVALVFKRPKLGLILFVVYSFIVVFLMREVGKLPFSYGFEAILLLTWIAAIFYRAEAYEWSNLNSDIVYLGIFWFVITVLELFNPLSAGLVTWIPDARYIIMWILVVPLTMAIFNKKKDLDLFLILIIGLSLLAAFNGIKQEKIGFFPGEQEFINGPARATHILFGQLRVFSFYSDAGQFGASMASLCVIAFVLALGPFAKWKKILCTIAALIFLYCMFISGTRGALFALITGLLVVLVTNRKIKIIMFALVIGLGGFCFLKYTNIGQSNYQIRRMRTALNPEDASLNVRIENQKIIKRRIAHYPFGAGIGSIGFAAKGQNTIVADIPPDSYWVKIWASYGVVGFVIWFSIMMYIVGKTCGIIWVIKDPALRIKLTALTAGTTGLFLCSYGNEVMNAMPSSMIVYMSWAFIFLGPKMESELKKELSHV